MSQTPLRPGEPLDPELRDRYARDAEHLRQTRRAESARLAAEVPPSRTPSGPIWVVAGLISLVLVAAAGFLLAGPMLEQSETTEYALPTGVTALEVDSGVGDVRIRAAEAGEDPEVVATTTWGLRQPDVSVDVTGGTATLEARCPSGVFAPCSTDWTVVVPEDVDVDTEAGVGQVVVEGITGDLDLETGVGDVRLVDAAAERITADLGVGSLLVHATEPPQSVYARVGVGSVSVQLPDTVSYDINATGGVGEVRNDLGSVPGADRTVTLEGGVGEVRVSAS